jgi:hypothetical protein
LFVSLAAIAFAAGLNGKSHGDLKTWDFHCGLLFSDECAITDQFGRLGWDTRIPGESLDWSNLTDAVTKAKGDLLRLIRSSFESVEGVLRNWAGEAEGSGE